ncbi:DNA-directed RNA polymerase subunit omega, partial [Lacticaseibacillus paracasei subsp. paracasei CNCM I-4649]
ELESGDLKMLSDYKSDKSVGKALEEIAAGDVIIDPKSKCLSVMQKNWIARIRNERLIVLAV